ncbi:Hypothetical protein CINCED_3A012966, partial [Cinara cedri]
NDRYLHGVPSAKPDRTPFFFFVFFLFIQFSSDTFYRFWTAVVYGVLQRFKHAVTAGTTGHGRDSDRSRSNTSVEKSENIHNQ